MHKYKRGVAYVWYSLYPALKTRGRIPNSISQCSNMLIEIVIMNRHFCHIITVRNEVGARLCFYPCLWFCSQGGICPIVCWDTPPRWTKGRHPPGSSHPLGTNTPQEQTPPGTRSPWEQTSDPPRSRPLPDQASPPGADPLPVQCILGDTGNKQAVRILLQCNLVYMYIYTEWKRMQTLHQSLIG